MAVADERPVGRPALERVAKHDSSSRATRSSPHARCSEPLDAIGRHRIAAEPLEREILRCTAAPERAMPAALDADESGEDASAAGTAAIWERTGR